MVLNDRVSGRDEHALVVVTHMASPDHQFIAHIPLASPASSHSRTIMLG